MPSYYGAVPDAERNAAAGGCRLRDGRVSATAMPRCRAGHWCRVLSYAGTIPTNRVGTPHRVQGYSVGTGSIAVRELEGHVSPEGGCIALHPVPIHLCGFGRDPKSGNRGRVSVFSKGWFLFPADRCRLRPSSDTRAEGRWTRRLPRREFTVAQRAAQDDTPRMLANLRGDTSEFPSVRALKSIRRRTCSRYSRRLR